MSNTAQAVVSTVTVQKTKCYYLGASRVAMRQSAATDDGVVSYLHADVFIVLADALDLACARRRGLALQWQGLCKVA